MPRFAKFQLSSNWGLSSDIEIASHALLSDAIARGASIIFTPTITLKDPLSSDPIYAYARFKLLSASPTGLVVLTRPLGSSFEEIENLLNRTKGDVVKVLSLAARSLSDAHEILNRFENLCDAIEVDVNLTCLLSTRGVSYSIELVRELVATSGKPLVLKLNASSLNLLDLGKITADSGANALVVTPNIVYKIGKHFFRLHSSYISPAVLMGLTEKLAEVDVDVAIVVQSWKENLLEIIPLRVFDVSYLLSWMTFRGGSRVNETPLSWRPINTRLKVYARKGAKYCPYGLIKEEGIIEGCNYCGVCLELNDPGLVELATFVSL
ncbi:MAG: hypothetical protein NZ954_03005 [Thermofilaceae archaeon]|nr:hypothetical protein [Thermofilaceae archaeon]MDW8004506.1 hypothetical protein [Thermofilaceae archaeon]